MTITYAEALATVRQLPREERARLIGQLATELITSPETVAPNEARATMARLRHEFAQMPRPAGTLAEQAQRDRDERETMMSGRVGDVHA